TLAGQIQGRRAQRSRDAAHPRAASRPADRRASNPRSSGQSWDYGASGSPRIGRTTDESALGLYWSAASLSRPGESGLSGESGLTPDPLAKRGSPFPQSAWVGVE